jgi:hypothetical protein
MRDRVRFTRFLDEVKAALSVHRLAQTAWKKPHACERTGGFSKVQNFINFLKFFRKILPSRAIPTVTKALTQRDV